MLRPYPIHSRILAITLLVLLVKVGMILLHWAHPGVPYGYQDPDVWIRLFRVEQLHDGGGWYNRTVPLNAPYGLENHWTRPLDLLLMALAWPASLFVPYKQALLFSAIVFNPFIWWLSVVAALRFCRACSIGIAGQWMAAIVLLMDMMVSDKFAIGRADHHSLLLFIFMWMLAMVAWFCRTSRWRYMYLAGMIAGLGLWVAPEFLFAIGLVAAWLGLDWLITGDAEKLRTAQRFLWAAWLVILMAVVLEWPIDQWLTVSHMRVSVVHLSVVGLTLLLMFLLDLCSPLLPHLFARVAVALAFFVAEMAGLQLAYPRFYEGPLAETPHNLWPAFMQFSELLPLHRFFGTGETLVILLTFAVAVVPYVICLRRRRHVRMVSLLLMMTVSYTMLALYMWRWGPYGVVTSVPGWALLADMAYARIRQRKAISLGKPPRFPRLAALGIAVWVWSLLYIPVGIGSGEMQREDISTCLPVLIHMIEQDAATKATGDPQAVVITHMNQAGELLFWTRHPAIASNYNYNADGIRDLDQFLFAQNEQQAYEVVRQRKAGVVLLCTDLLEKPFMSLTPGPSPVFLRQVAQGHYPSWLVPIPGKYPKDMLFLRVKPVIK